MKTQEIFQKTIAGFAALMLLALLFIPLQGCNSNTSLKAAKGDEEVIYVVADSLEWESMRVAFEQVFERIVITPQAEKLFQLVRVNYSDLNNYKMMKNIIVTAPFQSQSRVGKYLREVFDSAATVSVIEGKVTNVNKRDVWAANQLVMFITATDEQQLEYSVLRNGDNLVYAFQKISDERVSKALYSSKFGNIKDQAKLYKDYGFNLFVQVDYYLATNKPEDNFVWLRRAKDSNFERWVFIHWIDNASPDYLNRDSILTIRNRATGRYYRAADNLNYVTLQSDSLATVQEFNFNGKYALMTQGLWKMTDEFMGGPFLSYTFYDAKSKRLYMIDGSIFAPGHFKRNLIQQMDILLKSFRLNHEIDAETKKQLEEEIGKQS